MRTLHYFISGLGLQRFRNSDPPIPLADILLLWWCSLPHINSDSLTPANSIEYPGNLTFLGALAFVHRNNVKQHCVWYSRSSTAALLCCIQGSVYHPCFETLGASTYSRSSMFWEQQSTQKTKANVWLKLTQKVASQLDRGFGATVQHENRKRTRNKQKSWAEI